MSGANGAAAAAAMVETTAAANLAAYDDMPAPLRRWLATAVVNWNAISLEAEWRLNFRRRLGDERGAEAMLEMFNREQDNEREVFAWDYRRKFGGEAPGEGVSVQADGMDPPMKRARRR